MKGLPPIDGSRNNGKSVSLALTGTARRSVFVIVVIIRMRVDLLRVGEVEDEAKHRHFSDMKRIGHLLQLLLLTHTTAGDEHQAFGPTTEYALSFHNQPLYGYLPDS